MRCQPVRGSDRQLTPLGTSGAGRERRRCRIAQRCALLGVHLALGVPVHSLVAELRSTQPPARSPTVKEIAEPALLQSEQRSIAMPPMAEHVSSEGRLKVLIIDDHALIREALHAVLRQLKRETLIFEASNSHQAMQIVEQHPDLKLVLLDINLPDRDGFSVLAELRERHATIAIIMLSGLDDQDQVKRAFSLGALGFIPKTTEREVMLHAIRLVLSGGIYIPSEILG